MFSQILVPTDFSKKHIKSLIIAENLAEKYKSTIHLLHVIEVIPDVAFEEFATFYEKLEKKAQNRMTNLISGYESKISRVRYVIKFGDRAQEILNFAKNNKIDLIVMNSHKIRKDNPVQDSGSISYKVALLSKIPVMLIK